MIGAHGVASAILRTLQLIAMVADATRHLHPHIDEVITGVDLERQAPLKRVKRNAAHFGPLRIKVHFDDTILALSADKQLFINDTLLPQAVGFWEKALMVRQEHTPILLDRKCISNRYFVNSIGRSCSGACHNETRCGEVLVPEDHLAQCIECFHDEVFKAPWVQSVPKCSMIGPTDGVGVADTDFVLYVSAAESTRCNAVDTIAYAAHCQQEAKLDRPIAGHVNICPASISTAAHDSEVLMSTVKHEILHALGFNAALYAFYRDDDGKPRTPRNANGRPEMADIKAGYYIWSNDTIQQVTRQYWWTNAGLINHRVNMMVTPRVIREARRHFNCSLLEGAELENQGEQGTHTSHWEKRLFENEAMTGTHTQNPVYSRITFALMEDTGWYRAKYIYAQPLHWGRHLGCAFAMNSCAKWIAERRKNGFSPAPYCDELKDSIQGVTRTTCTDTRDSLALCNLVKHDHKLPVPFRNMLFINGVPRSDLEYYGGSVELSDYCPYNQEFEWKESTDQVLTTTTTAAPPNSTQSNSAKNQIATSGPSLPAGQQKYRRDSRCEIDDNLPTLLDNAALESYGQGAYCFEHGHKWIQRKCNVKMVFRFFGAGCYQHSCSNDGRLIIHLFNETANYTCEGRDQLITVRQIVDGWLHEGSIICPACSDLCDNCAPEPAILPEPLADPYLKVPCTGAGHKPTLLLITTMMLLLTGHAFMQ